MNLTERFPEMQEHFRGFNWVLLGTALALSVIGVLFIMSASGRYEEQGDWSYSDKPLKQLVWLGVGLGVFFMVTRVRYRYIMRLSYPIYILALLTLGAMLLVSLMLAFTGMEEMNLGGLLALGRAKNGARRWIFVGQQAIQPSEFMKIALILCLARYLMYRENYRRMKGLIVPFLLTLAPMALVFNQPDLGTALLFLPTLFVLLYVAGARLKHLMAIMLLGLVSLPALYFGGVMVGYQRGRLESFINPEKHAAGGGYHVLNAMNAIGSGGVFGKGWRQGMQNVLGFIPFDDNDFIFAVLAEEWGLAGGLLLLGLYFVIIFVGLGIAARTREPFGRLVAVGVVLLYAVQIFINIGMTVHLVPVTGLTLPFVSYGGSSLVTCFLALGLLVNVGKYREPVLADEDFQ